MIKLRMGIMLAFILLILTSCAGLAEENNRGNELSKASNYDEAIIAYSSAQVNDPDHPVPYLNSAQAYFQQGNLDLAVEVIEQAILRGDENIQSQAYYNLGNFYYLSQQFEDAIIAYREALLINPNDRNARHNLELAMLYNSSPTPFDDEMKTEPDESQVDPTAQPTNQPLDNDGPTPTPPPADVNDEEDPEGGITGENFGSQTEGTPSPREEATLSVPEAQQLLDPIKQDQTIYGEFSDEVATPTDSDSGKSW